MLAMCSGPHNSSLFWFFFFKVYVYVSFACIYACVSHGAWCLGKPKENTRYPETGVIVVSLHVGAVVLDKNTKTFNCQVMSPPPF